MVVAGVLHVVLEILIWTAQVPVLVAFDVSEVGARDRHLG
jgi:hypothetical protein